jgi:hypothetical protein
MSCKKFHVEGLLAVVTLLLSFSAFAFQALPTGASLAKERTAFRDMQLRDENGVIKPDGLANGIMQRKALVKPGQMPMQNYAGAALQPLAGVSGVASWTALGPGNIGGRILAIAAHPTMAGTMWAGTAGGGIWETTNAGASWAPVNDFMGSLAVRSLAIDPTNPHNIYAGTGEGTRNADALRGAGLFKSTDGGVTWSPLAATIPSAANPNWYYVNKIVVHPTNGLILLAATSDMNSNGFIYRSADGGTSWTRVYSGSAVGTSNTILSLSFDPNNGNNAVFGDKYGDVTHSIDAGLTWTRVNVSAVTTKYIRVEVAYAKSTAVTIYASVDNSLGVAGSGQIWKSVTGGTTWALQSTPGHLDTQGDYANAIWVDPTNAAHLVVGGLDLYQSTDNGLTTTKISEWRYAPKSPHADHHVIVSDPGYNGTTNKTVYNGNDGGVYSAADITLATSATSANGWANLNNGFAVTQLYSAAGSTAAAGRIITGAQDNGSLKYFGTGTNWVEWSGGDGGFSAVDSTDTSGKTFYGEYVYLDVSRTLDGGASAVEICNGITDANSDATFGCGTTNVQKANFIAPFIVDPNNNKRMLAGGESLWQTTDATVATPVWTNIYNRNGLAAANDYISAITVAQGDPNRIWIGTDKGTVAYTANGAAIWTPVAGLPARYVFRILVDKNNLNSVYVSFGGYAADNLYHSADGGGIWTNITRTLPAVPIRSITMHPSNSAWLYVGTEVGIFDSQDGGATWSTTNDGPANVSVEELSWMDNVTLLAGTHGRGMFKATVVATTPTSPVGVTAAAGDGQNTISWANVAGAAAYNIYWSTTADVTPLNGIIIPNVSNPYIHTGLTNGVAYYYVITAVDAIGESAASTLVTATPAPPPSVPLGVIAAAGNKQNTISWANVAGAAAYNIYWSTTADVTPLNGIIILNVSNPYIHTGLTNGTAYYYVVTAANASGESAASAQVTATPAAPGPAGGGGGGGGCSVMPVGANPDSSLPLTMLVMLAYWLRRRVIRTRGAA